MRFSWPCSGSPMGHRWRVRRKPPSSTSGARKSPHWAILTSTSFPCGLRSNAMRPIPSIPTFALVGQPNEGKTTVMATLAEDDRAAISPVPGTTRIGQRYPVLIDDTEILIFYDTPGFENPEAVLQWFKENRTLPDPLQSFLATFADSGKFRQ